MTVAECALVAGTTTGGEAIARGAPPFRRRDAAGQTEQRSSSGTSRALICQAVAAAEMSLQARSAEAVQPLVIEVIKAYSDPRPEPGGLKTVRKFLPNTFVDVPYEHATPSVCAILLPITFDTVVQKSSHKTSEAGLRFWLNFEPKVT